MSNARGHPLVELTLARLREFVREPGAIFWTFGFPVLLAIGLGIAFRSKPASEVRVAVVGQGPGITQTLERLSVAKGIQPVRLSAADAATALRSGKVDLIVEVAPSAPTAGATASGPPRLIYRFDTLQPESRYARLLVDDALQRALGRQDVLRADRRPVSAKGSRYIDFLIPGLIGLNVMGSSMWGIGYAVVLARRRRLLKRLAATPMRRSHYLLAYIFSRILFLVAEVGLLVAFGWLAFGVAVRGSLLAVTFVALLGSLSFMGLALLVAARPESTEVASGWMNAAMLPMWLLSGSFFSYERFPAAVQPFLKALPLTAFNDALRAVMNDGAALWQTWPSLAVLAAWGAGTFWLALKLFRWQ
jgi:ABC-type multidrug transport system permease subunit